MSPGINQSENVIETGFFLLGRPSTAAGVLTVKLGVLALQGRFIAVPCLQQQ